ncbi:MAG: HAD family phosphatase [Oscillospiraceae bacterium]|nr:HAD family phosphatase [Oscillospiraceae bacterium]
MGFKGAIFDLDGTLLDSMGVWRKIDVDFLAQRGLAVPDDYIRAITAMHYQLAAEYTIQRFGLRESPEAVVEEWNRMAQEAYARDVLLKPGARRYLEKLRREGVRIAAATASAEGLYLPALRHNGVEGFFDAFTTVTEVPRGKGFPDIYLLAAQKLGLEPGECAVYEDILAGIRGAKDGGFYAVGIYDRHSDYEWEEIRRLADLSVTGWEELLDKEDAMGGKQDA